MAGNTSGGYFRVVVFLRASGSDSFSSMLTSFLCFFTAMSSYLYIVKYELPIVIQAFTGSSGWVAWVFYPVARKHFSTLATVTSTHDWREAVVRCIINALDVMALGQWRRAEVLKVSWRGEGPGDGRGSAAQRELLKGALRGARWARCDPARRFEKLMLLCAHSSALFE